MRKLLAGLCTAFKGGDPTQTSPKQDNVAQARPEAPCGNNEEHYYWIDGGGLPCPICHRNKIKAHEDREETRILRKLAVMIAEEMKR